MREPTTDSAVAYAVALLSHYGFELRGYKAEELVNLWLRNYQANWVRLGVIEALYQGRYKAVSVEQILAVWARRGQPIYRFNHEFERLISRKLPQNLTECQLP
jgi:predicted lipoprotein with Yx(FWY)xxD motif